MSRDSEFKAACELPRRRCDAGFAKCTVARAAVARAAVSCTAVARASVARASCRAITVTGKAARVREGDGGTPCATSHTKTGGGTLEGGARDGGACGSGVLVPTLSGNLCFKTGRVCMPGVLGTEVDVEVELNI
jgi:hypothetical protein